MKESVVVSSISKPKSNLYRIPNRNVLTLIFIQVIKIVLLLLQEYLIYSYDPQLIQDIEYGYNIVHVHEYAKSYNLW